MIKNLWHLLRSSLAIAIGSLTLAIAPGAAQALPVTVNVGGTNYDITTFLGSYDDNLAKFATPANGGTMPWAGIKVWLPSLPLLLACSLALPIV